MTDTNLTRSRLQLLRVLESGAPVCAEPRLDVPWWELESDGSAVRNWRTIVTRSLCVAGLIRCVPIVYNGWCGSIELELTAKGRKLLQKETE